MRRTATAALITLVSAGCGEDQAPNADRQTTQVALSPTTVIGELDGDPALLFGDVRSVAVDDGGIVYVGDRIGASVRAYSPEGRYLGVVAQEGEGPGEIQGWPADLALDARGSLHVRDGARVTTFARSAGGVADSLVDLWTMDGYGNLSYDRSQVGADGLYYYPDGAQRRGERPRHHYRVFSAGEPTGDTLPVPDLEGMAATATAFYPLGPGGGRIVALSRVPFAPVPSWAVTSTGTVISTDGASDVLIETDLTGDTVRILELGDAGGRPVPPGERADSLRALEARIDSLPGPLENVVNLGPGVRERALPERVPQVVRVHAGPDGRAWIERWPDEGAGDTRRYDLIDGTGAVVTSLRLEAPLLSEPQPYFGRNWVAGVVRDDSTGVQRVVLFRLPDDLTAGGADGAG